MPEVLVRARGLTKRFGSFTAVDGINFDLFRGEAFGFLGPNGAGKSSTMRMLGCVSPPTSGDLTILGGDPVRDGAAIRARLGVVPQEDTLDNELTVRENLLVYGRYFGLPRKLINERTDLDLLGGIGVPNWTLIPVNTGCNAGMASVITVTLRARAATAAQAWRSSSMSTG